VEETRQLAPYQNATGMQVTSAVLAWALTKMRWRIERDFQELKQEIGLDHYKGRGWRDFHGHTVHRGLRLPDLQTGEDSPSAPRAAAALAKFPPVTDPAAPPIRPQRQVPNSIATMHHPLIVALARALPRCPCCARRFPPTRQKIS
jgi:hypothetical protein